MGDIVMFRTNKTVGNLKKIWEELDTSSGNIYSAIEKIDNMVDMPKELKDLVDRIDVSAVDSVKNCIEEMIVEKGGTIEDVATNEKEVSVIKAVAYAKVQMSARIEELEGFLDIRDYSPAQRANLERKLEGYKEDLKEFKSIKL